MYNNKKIVESINKSKSIWELINEETGKLKASYETINIKENGEFISDPTNVAQLFNTYFTETAGKLQNNFESEATQHKVSKLNLSTSIFLTPTDDEEIISVIKELKNKKSSGLDGISSFLIKKCYIHLIKPLTFIINLSLNTGEFPELYKISNIRPLLKKGSKYEVENYRPISMISTFSKTLKKSSKYHNLKTPTVCTFILKNCIVLYVLYVLIVCFAF